MRNATAFFRLLGDDARLRILRLLQKERLNVSELTSILGIAQPGVSRHLRLLKEGGLVEEEREGAWTYYRLRDLSGGLASTWKALRTQILALDGREDDARLQEVLRHRQEEFRHERGLVPGKSWAAWARAIGHLLPTLRVADLGCGQGHLAIEAARWAERVIAVDISSEVLARAKNLAASKGVHNVVWRKGEIEDVPVESNSVDVAMLSQSVHHAKDPFKAIKEAVRITVPGGSVLILDLKSHREEWVRKLGDKWLGFEERELRRMMKDSGLVKIRTEVAARRRGDPFQVVVASGRKRA